MERLRLAPKTEVPTSAKRPAKRQRVASHVPAAYSSQSAVAGPSGHQRELSVPYGDPDEAAAALAAQQSAATLTAAPPNPLGAAASGAAPVTGQVHQGGAHNAPSTPSLSTVNQDGSSQAADPLGSASAPPAGADQAPVAQHVEDAEMADANAGA